jgi:hypothetical protein
MGTPPTYVAKAVRPAEHERANSRVLSLRRGGLLKHAKPCQALPRDCSVKMEAQQLSNVLAAQLAQRAQQLSGLSTLSRALMAQLYRASPSPPLWQLVLTNLVYSNSYSQATEVILNSLCP